MKIWLELGLPMGSCISAVLSNIFMEHIEQLALSTFLTLLHFGVDM